MKNFFNYYSRLQSIFIIIILGLLFFTRFFGNQYDAYRHLHPDERWLIMVVDKLHIPNNLDPDFFAYGSLPMYILKMTAQGSDTLFQTSFDNYDGLLRLGRSISSLMDIGTSFLVFAIAYILTKNKNVAALSFFSYLLMFFPTQNSNFFIVDNFVNFFFSLTMLSLLKYWKKPDIFNVILIGISYGFLLSSKITPIVISPIILSLLVIRPFIPSAKKVNLWIRLKETLANITQVYINKSQAQFSFQLSNLKKSVYFLIIFVISIILTSLIAMPYAWLKHDQFTKELLTQIKMNSDAYVFPYTLQYVNTLPYQFYFKQIIYWGIGPILGLLLILGMFLIIYQLRISYINRRSFSEFFLQPMIPYLLANFLFILIIGRSAVKFMRYMLPMYPFFAVIIGITLATLWQTKFKYSKIGKVIVVTILLISICWYFGFLSIYSKPHTRIVASEWMLNNIQPGSTLAVEHWDDRLPLYGSENFNFVELEMYNQPDNENKWQIIRQQLDKADYIILASNRLFEFLPKLSSCNNSPPRCYPLTSQYYQNLFSNSLGFTKIAEFTSRPNFLGISITDDHADESFTVYDHPHVIIFKKDSPTSSF